MKWNGYKFIGLALFACGILCPQTMVSSPSAKKDNSDLAIAKALGWKDAKNNRCLGYYYEPKWIRRVSHPPSITNTPVQIKADGPTTLNLSGKANLSGHIKISQPGRELTADHATMITDHKTGKTTHIQLKGHIRLTTHEALLASDSADLNLKQQVVTLKTVRFRFNQTHATMGHYTAWGAAKSAKRFPNGQILLSHVIYSTCPPIHPCWKIYAGKMRVDLHNENATVHHALVKIHGVPIFYSPYLPFTINHARKSGLLSPTLSTSTSSGFTVGLPLYLNFAPNVDGIVSAEYSDKRGYALSASTRFITAHSHGKASASVMLNDPAFRHYIQKTLSEFPNPSPYFVPFLNELKKASTTRYYLAFQDTTQFDQHWKGEINTHYVSDPYYLRDLDPTSSNSLANQLLNQGSLMYEGQHWYLKLLLQDYQTLHLIDQISDPTINQYARLPELDVDANFPNAIHGLGFNLTSQFVNFSYHSEFIPVTANMPVGQRYHLRPTISYPINFTTGFIKPEFSFDNTSYHVERRQPGQIDTSNRSIGMLDIDSGLYFSRNFHWGHHDYTQTLEPRLYYLYVPYQNQSQYPVYDTQVLPFSYAALFSKNRFSGFDRIQNANQISMGLTTRVINHNDGFQRLEAGIGIGYRFDATRVCLSSPCTPNTKRFTPLASMITYYPAKQWAISGSYSYDPLLKQTNNALLNIQYTGDGRHIIEGGYEYVHVQPNDNTLNNLDPQQNSSLFHTGIAWPLGEHWSGLGYAYYNATQQRFQSYFAGLQYNSCCWGFRFFVRRSFQGSQPIDEGSGIHNFYNTDYIVQFQLKGIGSAGNDNPNAILRSSIPGYMDPFKY